jgi:hypothetical protein
MIMVNYQNDTLNNIQMPLDFNEIGEVAPDDT